MSVINMAKNIKEVHPNALVCYKVGAFVNCYGKDAYIISYLFDYKIRMVTDSMISIGFPINAIPKITARFQREKINYIIIDTKSNYNVDEEEDYNNLNRYNEVMDKAQKEVKIKVRVQKISNYLIENKKIELIREIEKLIDEGGEI